MVRPLFRDEMGYEAACYLSADLRIINAKGSYAEMDTGITESDTSCGSCQAAYQLSSIASEYKLTASVLELPSHRTGLERFEEGT